MRTFNLILSALISALTLSCATGEKFTSIKQGMDIEQVQSIIGKPDSVDTYERGNVYMWLNRIVSGWGMDKADYYVVTDTNNVVKGYGQKNFREHVRPAYAPVVVQPASVAPTSIDCSSNTLGSTTFTNCNGH